MWVKNGTSRRFTTEIAPLWPCPARQEPRHTSTLPPTAAPAVAAAGSSGSGSSGSSGSRSGGSGGGGSGRSGGSSGSGSIDGMVAPGRSSDQARLSVSYAVAPATAPKRIPRHGPQGKPQQPPSPSPLRHHFPRLSFAGAIHLRYLCNSKSLSQWTKSNSSARNSGPATSSPR